MVDIATLGISVNTDADNATSELDRLEAQAAKTEGATTKLGKASKTAGAAMASGARQARTAGDAAKMAGGGVANLGAQFNDIGVMLAAGQSPLLLAMQQGTQVNQVLDTMGSTATARLGALKTALLSVVSPANLLTLGVIAGGAALAQWAMSAMSAGDDASDLADKMEELQDRSKALNEELRALRLGVSEDEAFLLDRLRDKTLEIAEAERLVTQAQNSRQFADLLPERERALAALRSESEELQSQIDTLVRQQNEREVLLSLTAETAEYERMLGEQMGFTAEQLRESEVISGLLRDGISASVVMGMQFAGINMSGGITDAQIEAAKLADTLGIAFSRAMAIATMSNTPMMNDEDAVMSQGVITRPITQRYDRDTLMGMGYTNDYLESQGMFAPVERSGGGRSSGGASAAQTEAQREFNAAQQEAQRIIEGMRNPFQVYSDDLENLQSLLDAGHLSTEQYTQAQKDLHNEFMDQQWGEARSQVDDFTDALFEGEDAIRDFFKTWAIEHARAMTSSGLQDLFGIGSGLVGGKESGIGGFFGSLFGGFRADGGEVSSSKGYIVGERGPEWFSPSTSGSIIPNNALGSASAQNLNVSVSMDDNGNWKAMVRNEANQIVAQSAPAIVNQSVTATFGQMRKSKAGTGMR